MMPPKVSMRILRSSSAADLRSAFERLAIDPYGIRIMLPKAQAYVIQLNKVPRITATILKQEMLSLGAEAALPRDILTGKLKTASCLLIGNLSQFVRLKDKLKRQPFGLAGIGAELLELLENFCRNRFVLRAADFTLSLGDKPRIMGVINLTPDSFSGDGVYAGARMPFARSQAMAAIIERARRMVCEGASIIDLGGESSRPGARAVSLADELARTIPVIRYLAKQVRVPISIDTHKPEVARAALDSGASIINDISGLRDPAMARIACRYKAGVVIMHMRGNPRTMQKRTSYVSLMDELTGYFSKAVSGALSAGIGQDRIVIDPGIGFSKVLEQNLKILNHLEELKSLGRPILVGTSRKSFIGKILKSGPDQRLMGTVASCVLAAQRGAHILRVHDVKEVHQALQVAGAIMQG